MKRVLVIRFSAMGDVAMSLPVLKLVLKDNPNLEITFLTGKNVAVLFENIERLIPIGIDFKKQYKGIAGLRKLQRALLKNTKFDAVIDLHNVLRSNILGIFFRLSTIPVFKINKERDIKRKMIQTKQLHQLPHTSERYLRVFNQAGIKTNNTDFNFPSVSIAETDKETIDTYIKRYPKPFIAFAPFAKHAPKSFPISKSEELIQALSKKYTVFLLGGKENAEQFEIWESSFRNTYSTIELSLPQQVALMSHLKAVISMDSANMHLAAIQGVSTISIWGATHPFFGFSGIGTNSSSWISAQESPACRPCSVFGNKPCGNKQEPYACMNRIKVDTIINAIETISDKS